ncbi:MAG: ribonuclease P protein component [Candidatus Melainabacteria bacterium GWF2_37_15]|nr:MAG: ribonuclease P protein component [Candidatus Melainabacteria bacterium GWF2_37_15]
MLPKPERLTKSSEFGYVYHQKRSVANSLLVLYVSNKKRDESIPTRVGFIVGKKVHKRAVKRNKAKRHIREAYKVMRKAEDFPLKDFQHLIFIARPPIVEADYKQVYDAVADCITRAAKRFK